MSSSLSHDIGGSGGAGSGGGGPEEASPVVHHHRRVVGRDMPESMTVTATTASSTAAATTTTTTEEVVISNIPRDDEAEMTTTATREVLRHEQKITQDTLEQGSLAMGISMGQPVDPPPLKESSHNKKMEALEIDMGDDANHDGNTADGSEMDLDDLPDIPNNKSHDEFDDDLDRADADMEGLLTGGNQNKRITTKRVTRRPKTLSTCACCSSSWCPQVERHGNCVVFLPRVFHRTGWGIMGPHWFGPPCVVGIILAASSYFIKHSLARIGPITAAICIIFTIANIYFLINTCYRNPGIVMPTTTGEEDDDDGAAPSPQHRWCDFCKAYQPPCGAHCPDCNCCIQGYDHHCVWMGTCIGKKNYKQFIRFNLSWLMHLVYAVLWVSIIGPITYRNKDETGE